MMTLFPPPLAILTIYVHDPYPYSFVISFVCCRNGDLSSDDEAAEGAGEDDDMQTSAGEPDADSDYTDNRKKSGGATNATMTPPVPLAM